MTQLLIPEHAEAAIAGMDGWRISTDGSALVATYRFADFAAALAFTNKVGALAEAANHHPDFTLGWGYVGLVLTTHDAGGLTEKDIALANAIAASLS
jgi:4a-hydroxytetrahydrobiopterin dehydratase